jgi:hypothetical protein
MRCYPKNVKSTRFIKSGKIRCTWEIIQGLVTASSITSWFHTYCVENSFTTLFFFFLFLFCGCVQHGWMLVSHALAYVTASKNGVSEPEIEDFISLDDKVGF